MNLSQIDYVVADIATQWYSRDKSNKKDQPRLLSASLKN